MAIVKHDPREENESEADFTSLKNLIQIKAKQSGSQLGEFEIIGKVKFVAINISHKIVVIVKTDKIEIRDFQGKPKTLSPPIPNNREFTVVAISPDGRMIALAQQTNSSPEITRTPLHLFDIYGQPISTFERAGRVNFLAFSPNSQYILTSDWGLISAGHDTLVGHSEIHLFPANWQSSLEIICNRFRYHPVLNNPKTLAQDEEARGARETCQKYSMSWQNR